MQVRVSIVMFSWVNSWICKIMLRSRVIARFAIVAFSEQCEAKLVHVVLLLYLV